MLAALAGPLPARGPVSGGRRIAPRGRRELNPRSQGGSLAPKPFGHVPVPPPGAEPGAFRFSFGRSFQLSYGGMISQDAGTRTPSIYSQSRGANPYATSCSGQGPAMPAEGARLRPVPRRDRPIRTADSRAPDAMLSNQAELYPDWQKWSGAICLPRRNAGLKPAPYCAP
jgi:hypothetical protein